MQVSDVIALFSLAISVASILISWIFSSKKYELTTVVYNDVLSWYSQANEILILLQNNVENKDILLAKLSNLIEIGRFYFPNVQNEFGKDKPLAYRGLRVYILDLLVLYHSIFQENLEDDLCEKLPNIQRLFTSEVFEYLNPILRKRHLKQYTKVNSNKDKTIRTILNEDFNYINELIMLNNTKCLDIDEINDLEVKI